MEALGAYPARHGFDDFCKIEKQAFLAILMHGSSSSQKIAPGTSNQTSKSRFLVPGNHCPVTQPRKVETDGRLVKLVLATQETNL